jgi:hypothetical protein
MQRGDLRVKWVADTRLVTTIDPIGVMAGAG